MYHGRNKERWSGKRKAQKMKTKRNRETEGKGGEV